MDQSQPQPVLTLSHLTDQLNWPKLLRTGRMTLSTSRFGIGLFTAVLLGLLDALTRLWTDGPGTITLAWRGFFSDVQMMAERAWDLDASGVGIGLHRIAFQTPAALINHDWIGAIVIVPLAFAVLLVGLLAICRSAGVEMSRRQFLPWTRSLGFARTRIASVLIGGVGPVLFVVVVVLASLLAGLLLSTGWLAWLGVVALGVFYLLGVLAALVAFGFVLGVILLPAAIACEGTDGLDAVQRVYHYVLHKPLRFLLYLLVAGGSALLAVGLVTALLVGGISIIDAGTTVTDFSQLDEPFTQRVVAFPEEHSGWSAFWVSLWQDLFMLVVYGLTISAIGCAGTGVYLAMRRLCDGQEFAEIWDEADPAGVVRPAAGSLSEGDRVGSRIERQPEADQD